MQVIKWDLNNIPNAQQKAAISNFLYHHLEEYGDEQIDIDKCLAYTFNELNEKQTAGFIVCFYESEKIIAACVVNETGMTGFIPENILVYIATHADYRGKGLGKKLMQTVINEANGAIALHVESNNPAKKLYEKLGFTNKYLEMRYQK
ncbi:GNAT family N-acetyltransferase [Flavobacterium agricola]|uniref:GNAT family N-acetyltransferase n=1 Tax=Flavobacterium agricola TaxID=2870839 RepID=A0ABY6M3H3_9FLAO|nr:GNAT family N-acetyltransferase [Flavobacterium agricola]UYW02400.1 GNAT family N-acetyltransferase [Flavobacterium agricola]